jgi:hypothetical protein
MKFDYFGGNLLYLPGQPKNNINQLVVNEYLTCRQCILPGKIKSNIKVRRGARGSFSIIECSSFQRKLASFLLFLRQIVCPIHGIL